MQILDAASLADAFNLYGTLSFVVDDATMPEEPKEPSTIVDLSGQDIEILRHGKGETDSWM